MQHLLNARCFFLFTLFLASTTGAEQLQWPVSDPRITQDYACKGQSHGCFSDHNFHSGVDLISGFQPCAGRDVEVYPAAPGIVERIMTGCPNNDMSCGPLYGNHIIVKHGNSLWSLYGHLKEVHLNASDIGQPVDTTTSLGLMGESGGPWPCHLHFAVLGEEPAHIGFFTSASPPDNRDIRAYTPEYPTDCSRDGNHQKCLDPKRLIETAPVGILDIHSPGLSVLAAPDHPDTESSVAELLGGQVYMSLGTDSGFDLLSLPSTVGPSADSKGPESVYGWTEDGAFSPLFGWQVRIVEQPGNGVEIWADPAQSAQGSYITKVWDGQTYWARDLRPPQGLCTSADWYLIDLPPSRDRLGESRSEGWVCGEFVESSDLGFCQGSFATTDEARYDKGTQTCASPQPWVLSASPADVTDTSAVMRGFANSNGSGTEMFFRWKALGNPTTDSSPQSIAQGQTVAVTESIDLLECGTEYEYRLVARLGQLEYEGDLVSIVTDDCTSSGDTPTVTTATPLFVTGSSAIASMSFNSGGLPTDVWFTWSTSNPPIAPETLRISKPATPQNDTFSWALVNLACNTQYFFRGHAENASGAAPPSNIQTFTTASCDGGGGGTQDVDLFETTGDLEGGNGAGFVAAPDFYLTDDFPSSAHSGTHFAYLTQPDGYWGNNLSGGLISTSVEIPSDGDNLELEWWASISTNETLNGVFDTMTVYLVEPGNVQTEVMVLSNLQAGGGWKRYSRALASGWAGREVQVFFDAQTDASNTSVFRVDDIGLTATVPFGEEPTVSTGAADNITETSARLHLSVDAGGLPTEAWFDLEAGDDTPNDDTERFDVGSGTTTSNFQLSVGNLLCGTRYYYRPRAQNSEGSDRGSVRSFVTDSCSGTAPDADTDPADAITKTSAVLTADITPGGFPTTAYFRWGTTTSLLEQTSERPVGSGTSAVDFEEELSDLTCDTRYFFQAMAENSMGSDEGTIHSFRTLACGAPGDPESNLALMTQPLSCDGNTTSLMLRWNEVFDGGGTYTVRLEDGTEIATVDSATDGTRYLAQDELVQGSTFAAFVQAEGVANTERSNVIRMPILSRICEQPASDRHVPRRFTAWSPRTFCEAGEVKVEIAWALSINADTYAIRRASPSVSGATNYDGLTGLSFTDTVDTADAYRYSVTAHNAFGVASSFLFSVAVPENVCDPGAPAASIPISISAPYCDGNRERVDVTWSSVSGETHSYRLLTGGFFNLGAGMDLDPGAGTVAADIRWGRATGVTILSQPEDGSLRRMSRQLGAYIAANACDNPELAPQASTHDSVWSSADSTFLSGSVNPNGSVSDYFFEWGTSAAYGEETPRVDVGVGADFVIVGHALNGLQCETTYHYRIVSENLHGPSVGSDKVLETGSCPVNEAPVAAEDNYQVDEDQILVISAPGVLANDSDPNGDPMQAMLVALPEHGEVTLEIDGSFTYTPDPEFSGEDSFSYLASDGFLTSVEAVVDIVVAPVNDPPAISVVEPNGVGDSADLSFVIAWTDEDVDSGALVELWYSLDATCFAPTFLAGPFPEDDLEDVYTWNTASLPEGDYWILARISDGIAPIAEFCSEGPVSVTHSISLLFADGFESGSLSRWSETVGGAGLVLLSDDFSDGTLDDTIWSWSGNSVIEESGILALTADVTDQYGIIDSAVIGVDMDRTLLVERDVRHHFASDRFMGWLQIFSDDDPSFGLSVFYGNMTFFNGTLCPVERTVLTKQRTSPHVCAHVGGPNIGPELAPIWDTWYRERIEFEPSTGDVRYYIDDALEATWLADPLPTMDGVGHIQIRMVPWGWFTGHEQLVDNFVVSQP